MTKFTKAVLAGLALGVLLFAAPSFADTTVTTPAFTLTYIDGPAPENWNISLVDASPGQYGISLDTLNNDLAGAEARDLTGAGSFATADHWSVLQLDIQPGYRVTALTISGVAFGELGVGQVPDFPPGQANNAASFFMTVWDGTTPVTYGHMFNDFQAEQSLETGPTGLAREGQVLLGFSGVLSAQAWGVNGDGAFAESMALASIRDVALHIAVAPIPEPGTYAMLLAGLGVLAVRARRRLP